MLEGCGEEGRKRGKACEVVGRAQQLGVVRFHTTCLPDVLRPAVAPGLRAGSSTLVRAQLECCGNVLCVRVYDCVHLCGQAPAHRRPTVTQCGGPFLETSTPDHHHHLTPHYLTQCALWPGMFSRSTLHKCTHNIRMHAQARAHTWLQSNGDAWPPVKRCDGNSK